MTPEQQREQWLKRALPALAISVLYFAIGSGFVTDKYKKAKADFLMMQGKGINAQLLPMRSQEQTKLKDDIAVLEAEDKKIHDELAAKSSFLKRDGSQNDSLDQLATLLAEHNLQIIEEKHNDTSKDILSPALRDTQKWLKELFPPPVAEKPTAPLDKNKDPALQIWTISYTGGYVDTYEALTALANSDIKALPVSLTMQSLKNEAGKLAWTLNLWL